jgi:nucleoside-diphosphate-sugar epimerase
VRVLVSGGAGYLGSVLVPTLLENGYSVTVLDDFRYGQTPFNHLCLDKHFDVIRGDCRDLRILGPLLKKTDVFIPLAALVGAPLCERDRESAWAINCNAVELALKTMSPSQWVLIPTTNSGYGVGDQDKECTEESPLRPLSTYGQTKVAAEKAVLERANGISFRLATVFGMSPRMRIDLLVNDFVYRAVTDKAVVLFEPHFKRNYIHIWDVAETFWFGIRNFGLLKNNVYNVGLSTANLSKLELCQKIKEHVLDFQFMEAPIGEDPDQRNYVVSNAKLELTGWSPKIALSDGIRELIKGYRMLKNTRYGNV